MCDYLYCNILIGSGQKRIGKKIFRKVRPYLTFLNTPKLQSKVEELEQLNQSMKDRDKVKDDAIAHLSDQLIALTARLDSIEKRQ
jgi:hypothetical protein